MTDEKTQDEQNTHHEIIDKTGDTNKVEDKKAEAYKKFRAEAEAAELTRKGKRAAINNTSNKGTQTVEVSNFDMPFWSMVVFMVKWAIASIPAFLILFFLFAIFGGFILGIFVALN